jgi:predicted enzyme related to lactoylglutathione lyase
MSTRDTPWPDGTPCWVDYGAADVEAAKAFYTSVLGWSYTGGEPEYGGYLTCERKDSAAAGMGPQADPDDPPRWTTYFATTDAEAVAARISRAGGSVIVAPMDVGPMGRMVIAADPQGHVFGLWQAGVHTGARIVDEPGALVWTEAAVDDPHAARAFYAEVFGFRFDEMPGGEGYTTFTMGSGPLGGLGATVPGAPKGWSSCFGVASTDDAVATVQRSGGTVTMPAQDTEFGRFAVLQDPWGAGFSVMQVPEQ